MEYEKIEKVYDGQYLDYYLVTYRDRSGHEKVYEMVSRDKEIDTREKLYDHSTDAVVMIVNDPADEHVVLVREFRLELGKTIFGFPAGLIDPGETAAECAVRELKEETGLDMVDLQRDHLLRHRHGHGILQSRGRRRRRDRRGLVFQRGSAAAHQNGTFWFLGPSLLLYVVQRMK